MIRTLLTIAELRQRVADDKKRAMREYAAYVARLHEQPPPLEQSAPRVDPPDVISTTYRAVPSRP